jgi:hypothetical protein
MAGIVKVCAGRLVAKISASGWACEMKVVTWNLGVLLQVRKKYNVIALIGVKNR